MALRPRKIRIPSSCPMFNPETDKTLSYFMTDEAFVRITEAKSYKLYCEERMILMLDRNGYLYLYPSFAYRFIPQVEAFLSDYLPSIDIQKLVPYVGKLHLFHVGKRFTHVDTDPFFTTI